MAARKQKSIWLVTAGDYSDYRVVSAHSTEAGAKQAMDAINEGPEWPSTEILELVLDPPARRKAHVTGVMMTREGAVGGVWTDFTFDTPEDYRPHPDSVSGREGRGFFFVRTQDKKRAIKVANERRAQLIAANQW